MLNRALAGFTLNFVGSQKFWLLSRYLLGADGFSLHSVHIRGRRWSAIPFFVIFVIFVIFVSSCLRGGESWSRGSSWPYPMGALPDSKVYPVTSAVFTTKTRRARRREVADMPPVNTIRPRAKARLPTGNTIRAKIFDAFGSHQRLILTLY